MNGSSEQRVAVIDLGSNTARLIVLKTVFGHAYRLEDEIREVVRLRQGMTDAGLSPAAMDRGLAVMRLFKRFCDSAGVDLVLATATSAVREGANGAAFAAHIERQLGLPLRILDGGQEAYYGVLGVLNEMPLEAGVVLDIGGGSAQLSQVQSQRFGRGEALRLGALALTERFITSDPPNDAERHAVRAEIDRQLDQLAWLEVDAACRLVGLGGTIRNLAAIQAKRQGYPLDTLYGFELTRDGLMQSLEQFSLLPLEKRRKIPGLTPDRADIILAGALVVLAVLERLGLKCLTVATSGLREGIFFEQFWGHLPEPVIPDVRRFSVLNLARNYGYKKDHADHVRLLAERLFDGLAPLHGYSAAERELLGAAALLHDLGMVVGYNDHHKYSQLLIEYNGLPGFTPRETVLIALLTRYHRKGTPSGTEHQAILEARDHDILLCLAAILRLAECFERGRTAAVRDLRAQWDDRCLQLTLVAEQHPAVELWEAERNALALTETAFGRTVRFDHLAADAAVGSDKGATV